MKAPQFRFTALSLTTLSLAIAVCSAIAGNNHFAQAVPGSGQPVVVAQYVPPPPPSRGAPGGNRGAASRGCLLLGKKSSDPDLNTLIALVPETIGKQGTEVWGYTATQRPTFWFYVPYQRASIANIEFVLNDDQDKTLYRIPVTPPSEAGILRVQLPATAALQPNKLYNWFFKVRVKSSCSSSNPATAGTPDQETAGSADLTVTYVEGWIQRIPPNPSLANRLQQASWQQQAALYGENGYWYDVLTAIATAYQMNPTDPAIVAQWAALLQQANLGKLAEQPLVR